MTYLETEHLVNKSLATVSSLVVYVSSSYDARKETGSKNRFDKL